MGQKDSISSVPWWTSLIPEISEMSKIEHSGKMVLLMKILRHCELVGDKLLVFSQSVTTLDLIEEFLVMEGFENQSRNFSFFLFLTFPLILEVQRHVGYRQRLLSTGRFYFFRNAPEKVQGF